MPDFIESKLRVVSGSTYPDFAEPAAAAMGTFPTPIDRQKFGDGELCPILESLPNGTDLVIFQTVGYSPDQAEWSPQDAAFELALIADAARNKARRIQAVVPYLPFTRSDEIPHDNATVRHMPIGARIFASLLDGAGIERVFTMDTHSGQVEGMFRKTKVQRLTTASILLNHLRGYVDAKGQANVTLMAPGGTNGTKLTKKLAAAVHVPFGIANNDLEWYRTGSDTPQVRVTATELIGNVADRDVVIVDDILNNCKVALATAVAAKDAGARSVSLMAPHALLTQEARAAIAEEAIIEQVVTTNTTSQYLTEKELRQDQAIVYDVAPLCGQMVLQALQGRSISDSHSEIDTF